MILEKSQAQAVYSAMCALNKAGMICADLIFDEGPRVQWRCRVDVRAGLSGPREEHQDQEAFAAAYGLQ